MLVSALLSSLIALILVALSLMLGGGRGEVAVDRSGYCAGLVCAIRCDDDVWLE